MHYCKFLEYELNYGSRYCGHESFSTEAEARARVKQFNDENIEEDSNVPDYYIIAEYVYLKD